MFNKAEKTGNQLRKIAMIDLSPTLDSRMQVKVVLLEENAAGKWEPKDGEGFLNSSIKPYLDKVTVGNNMVTGVFSAWIAADQIDLFYLYFARVLNNLGDSGYYVHINLNEGKKMSLADFGEVGRLNQQAQVDALEEGIQSRYASYAQAWIQAGLPDSKNIVIEDKPQEMPQSKSHGFGFMVSGILLLLPFSAALVLLALAFSNPVTAAATFGAYLLFVQISSIVGAVILGGVAATLLGVGISRIFSIATKGASANIYSSVPSPSSSSHRSLTGPPSVVVPASSPPVHAADDGQTHLRL